MQKAYIGIDIGTTSVKCMVIDSAGEILASQGVAYPSSYPCSGWVEQEPEDWVNAVFQSIRLCLPDIRGYLVEALSFSGHMSSPVFLDAQGTVLAPCITVADSRCEKQADELRAQYEKDFLAFTGNAPMTWAVAPKLLWMKENHPEVYDYAATVLCAKDYVRYRLTGIAVTDVTDAGNWLLFDRRCGQWNEELIRRLDLKRELFPPVVDSRTIAGTLLPEAARETGLQEGIPVLAGAADMACSQLASGAALPGCIAVTLGTSGQVCMRVSNFEKAGSKKVTFHPGVQPDMMYTMASVFSGGLSVNWLYRLIFGHSPSNPQDFRQLGKLSEQIDKNRDGRNSVIFLPFLTGSGSPWFRQTDRAAFAGLGNDVTSENLLESVMEGVAFNILDNMGIFRQMGCPIDKITLAGGGINLSAWPAMIADIVGKDVDLLEITDVSTYGACLIARSVSMTSQEWEQCITARPPVSKTIPFSPENHELYSRKYGIYQKLCKSASKVTEEILDLCRGSNGQHKVIIFEDDSAPAMSLGKRLDWKAMNCRVICSACSNPKCLEIIRNEVPDFIFFDIHGPKTELLNIIAAVKSEFPAVQIVFLTECVNPEYTQKALTLGADFCLPKASETEKIRNITQTMLDKLENMEANSDFRESPASAFSPECSDANSFIVHYAIRYMEEHYAEKLTLNDVAKAVYVSQWHLSKLINQYANRSFPEILNNIRIEHARQLLKNPSLLISDVAEQVGFQEVSHFSRVFRKLTGTTANEYRQNAKH